jgi:hypothetical protein
MLLEISFERPLGHTFLFIRLRIFQAQNHVGEGGE